MTEPHGGADPTLFTCRATQDGGDWVVDGEKWYSSHANFADFIIVMAVTDPDAPPYERASMFILPATAEGIGFVRETGVFTEPLGSKGGHPYVRYSQVRVPASAMLGPRGGGFMVAQSRLGGGRIVELCRVRATFQRHRRNGKSAENFSAHSSVEHADEHSHLYSARFAGHRGARQLAGMADRLHSGSVAQNRGEALGIAMLVASIIGTASLSNSTILYTTRIPAAMSQDGYLPAWLGKIHPRFATPARAISVSLVLYCLLANSLSRTSSTFISGVVSPLPCSHFLLFGACAENFPARHASSAFPGGTPGLACAILFSGYPVRSKSLLQRAFRMALGPLVAGVWPGGIRNSSLGIWLETRLFAHIS